MPGGPGGNGANNDGMANKKYACIFSYENIPEKPFRCNVDDTNLIIKTLTDLKFKVENQTEVDVKDTENESEDYQSDEEDMGVDDTNNDSPPKYKKLVVLNQKPRDMIRFVQDFVRNRKDAKCILLYFIVQQDSQTLMTADDKELPLFTLGKQMQGNKCPVLIFIQATVTYKATGYSVLLNSGGGGGGDGDTTYTLPKSANMLLAYLPNCVGGQIVAKVLSEELPKPFDVYTNLTKVIERLNSDGCRMSPKFSSTLLEPLYFVDGSPNLEAKKDPSRCINSRKHLAKSFIFGKYSDPTLDMYEALQHDKRHLETLRGIGFELEHCIPEGKMTVEEFKVKMRDILLDVSLESCDCMMIIVSTHGKEGNQLHAYDACFSVDYIWQALCSCKQLENKPKVLLIDACRGGGYDEPVTYDKGIIGKGVPDKDSKKSEEDKDIHLCDTLIVMSSTDCNKSFAFTGSGSLLMNSLCEQLTTKEDRNMFNILTSAMINIAQQNVKVSKEPHSQKELTKVKQQITFTSTLQKCLYIHKSK